MGSVGELDIEDEDGGDEDEFEDEDEDRSGELEYAAEPGVAIDDDSARESLEAGTGGGGGRGPALATDRAWLARYNALRQMAERAQHVR